MLVKLRKTNLNGELRLSGINDVVIKAQFHIICMIYHYTIADMI